MVAIKAKPQSITPHQSHKVLDLNSVQEIPDSHVWKPIDGDDSDAGDASFPPGSLPPVIDLNGPDVMEQIGHACKTWGVFQLTNHGVPTSHINDIVRAGKSLFALPLDQKLKAARSADMSSGYGQSHYSSLFPKLMWYEGFTVFGSPLEHAQKLWPQDHNNFCQAVENYKKEMEKLADRLMWLMMGSLGIVEGDIDWAGPKAELTHDSPRAALQLNSYPVCPDPDRAMGLMAHTDSTIFTILHQTQVSGLQVRPGKSGWVTVPPVPGAFVINVGDLLHVLSNGLYSSVLHRAMVNRKQNRLSVVYFYGAPGNVKVAPLPKLVDSTHPPIYRPVNWKEYLATKAKYFNKALASIRVDYEDKY